MFLKHSKTFWLFIILFIAMLLESTSSTHLKTRKAQTTWEIPGICFLEYSQGNLHFSPASEKIYTKHGHCKEVSNVGDKLNDDVVYIYFNGDCNTCRAEIFDDAGFRGGSRIVERKECTKFGRGCDLDDFGWGDRVSSLKLCCDRIPGNEYKYDRRGNTCRFELQENLAWYDTSSPKVVESYPVPGGCNSQNFIGKELNDKLASITTTWECTDCTIQLFDDADFKGDSKTFTIGSDECPLTGVMTSRCDLKGWGERASSFKTCCPTGLQI